MMFSGYYSRQNKVSQKNVLVGLKLRTVCSKQWNFKSVVSHAAWEGIYED